MLAHRTLRVIAMAIACLGLPVIRADEGATAVNDLVLLVQSGIQQRKSDKSVAKSIRKLALSEKLDERTVEELESEGAGPETVASLEYLRQASRGNPASTKPSLFPAPPWPSTEEQKAFFRFINTNAVHYSASLPDFICTEVVKRFVLPRQAMLAAPKSIPAWQSKDVLTVKLSYFDNREKYELTLVNGRKTGRDYEASGGAISEGDFGSTLLEIFAPSSATEFRFDHWTHLRKRPTRVYAYRTLREHSHYKMAVGDRPDERHTIIAGRHGFLYADDETHMVMRITGEAESIPPGFPVTGQSSILDYDMAYVGDRQFLLPLRTQTLLVTARTEFKNISEFKDYRKFTGESKITFDAPETPKD